MQCALKLVFLKCIFEFMINTAPPASNSVYAREKLFWYPIIDFSNHVCHVQISRVRLLATLFSVSLYRYFFPVWSIFLTLFFLLAFFSLFLLKTLLVNDLAPGSIYILSLSPEFHFGKGISKALDLHTGQAYDKIKSIICQDTSVLLNS